MYVTVGIVFRSSFNCLHLIISGLMEELKKELEKLRDFGTSIKMLLIVEKVKEIPLKVIWTLITSTN